MDERSGLRWSRASLRRRRDRRRGAESAGLPLRRQGRPRRLLGPRPAVGRARTSSRSACAATSSRTTSCRSPRSRRRSASRSRSTRSAAARSARRRRRLLNRRGVPFPTVNVETPEGAEQLIEDDGRAAGAGAAGRRPDVRQGLHRNAVEQGARRGRLSEGAAAAPHGRRRPRAPARGDRRSRQRTASRAPSARRRRIRSSSKR